MKEKKLKHLAIIMDGNGRWAEQRGMTRSQGHLEGSKTFEKISEYILLNKKIDVLSVFAFSTDNFKRTKEEVDYLMNLFLTLFSKKLDKVIRKGIKVVFSGLKERLSEEIIDVMNKTEEKSKDKKNGILNICLNYGGQEEIVESCKKIVTAVTENNYSLNDLNRDSFYEFLHHKLPPIDLLIRTGGNYRISNFMLYQLAYAELFFTDSYFPALNEKEIDDAIEIFNGRERRFGGNHENKNY